MSTKIADRIDAAADYIEEHGWVQGVYEQGGHVCATEAVNRVCSDIPGILYFKILATLVRGLRAHEHHTDRFIPVLSSWNDQPGRTEQEVIDAFRLVAKLEREQ